MKLLNIKMICTVYPEGQKFDALDIEFDQAVDETSVLLDTFVVEGHVVENVQVSSSHIRLKIDPIPLTALEGTGREEVFVRKQPQASVSQTKSIQSECGEILKPWKEFKEAHGEIEPLVDDYDQYFFHSERTQRNLPYNLYLPNDYDETKSYPLVLFIHDRGPLSTETKTTLRQGIGALTFSKETTQSKYPCIVLAPQYAKVPRTDGNPDMLETTFDLVEAIQTNYAVDASRIYATGQSMGAMSLIQMGIRRPEFFTALWLVAGQEESDKILALKDAKLFIVVSQGDPKAFAGMNVSMALFEKEGTKVERAYWDQSDGTVEDAEVEALLQKKANVYYAVLKTEERGIQCHMDTWKVAYGIEGIIDWLFQQSKAKDC